MPAETHHILDETAERIYPIQLVQIGQLQNVPAPLVRVSTCGGLQLEVLQEVMSTDPTHGRYQVVTLHNRPKGSSTALTLLKILASLPEHYASKDWLTEHLLRTRSTADEDDEVGWGQGLIRVDNVVYLLRSLLCPPGIVGEETIRKVLVAYVRNHRESGPGYRLAADPLVWLDVDIITASVKQALLLEQEGKEALPCWEQVYALASKGVYLPDEAYSDWAKDTRLRVEGYVRQAVHALPRLYLSHDSEMGEKRVLVLLRTYWQSHPLDEDILRPLLELLGKLGYMQEAEEYYQRLCQELELEGHIPDLRTQDTIQNVRDGRHQQEQYVSSIQRANLLLRILPMPLSTQRTLLSPLPYDMIPDLISKDEHPSQKEYMTYNNFVSSMGQTSNSALLSEMIHRNFSKEITYDLLSSNIKTMNFRDEWQYIVNNLVSEAKTGLRAMVFDTELTRWWNTIAGQVYMKTNMELLKRRVPVRRIFILSSIDTRLRMNTLMNAYVHYKIGIDVKVCKVPNFQNSIPFTPDMFSVHDNLFVTLYYFSCEKPIANLLLEDKHILEFSTFYDELFRDDRLCTDIESILAHTTIGEEFFTSTQTQLKLLQRLDKIGSVTELARRL